MMVISMQINFINHNLGEVDSDGSLVNEDIAEVGRDIASLRIFSLLPAAMLLDARAGAHSPFPPLKGVPLPLQPLQLIPLLLCSAFDVSFLGSIITRQIVLQG
ncbi:hypothetical protein J6590_054964 [Homalodisca vitripennis]|nr:hypothetical protein J6590_054964 [Homalodisca vitripennis]